MDQLTPPRLGQRLRVPLAADRRAELPADPGELEPAGGRLRDDGMPHEPFGDLDQRLEVVAVRAGDRLGRVRPQLAEHRPLEQGGAEVVSPARFEIRTGDNHHHLVCRACGRTTDVDCVVGARPCLTPSDDAGYEVDEAEVLFWGLCPDCQQEDSRGNKELFA